MSTASTTRCVDPRLRSQQDGRSWSDGHRAGRRSGLGEAIALVQVIALGAHGDSASDLQALILELDRRERETK
jgi:hypothetical protein